MYTLTDQHEKEIQGWIDKLPDSLVKSKITNLFQNVFPTNRMTVEQLEEFLSYQNALPKEFQAYPQIVSQWLKNAPQTEKREAAEGTPKNEQADFAKMVADSHAHVKADKPEGDTGEQKQEILHTLNVTDKTLAGTKAEPHTEDDAPSYEEELTTEAKEEKKEIKKTGKKSKSQQDEDDTIMARNKNADPVKPEKTKTVVVVNNKKAATKPAPKPSPKFSPRSAKSKPVNKRK